MRNISTILSILAIVLIAAFAFWFSSKVNQLKRSVADSEKKSGASFKVAYFDIDSLEAHYDYFKDVLEKVKAKENAMNDTLNRMERGYQRRIAEWQKKGTSMTQAESEQAQQEYAQMQQTYQARKQSLQEELFKHNEDLKSDVKKNIENFLKEYNRQKNYSFIFAYESNSFIYYKDTAYNITQDLIDGLNSTYKK